MLSKNNYIYIVVYNCIMLGYKIKYSSFLTYVTNKTHYFNFFIS